MMALLLIIVSILTFSPAAIYSFCFSSATSGEDSSFTGVWKGDSVCQIKDSPCHDEPSVYYVTKGSEPNSFQMKMNKIIEGKEVTLGTVGCVADSSSAPLVCRLNSLSTWTWHLNKDVLDGEMQYRGQIYRKIHMVRAQ
jgi:hypothetical protein